MYNYEIPMNEKYNYDSKQRYLNEKKIAESAAKRKKDYTDFLMDSRNYFLCEAINNILQNSLDESTTEEDRNYGKALVEGFVSETGSIKLLSDFSRKSVLLAEMSELVNEAHKKVIHSCKEDSPCFKISKSINDDFFDKLIGMSDDKITEKINERVCNAIEDYVQDNVNDKVDLEELAEKTKQKIDNIKARNAEERNKIAESYTLQYQKQVNDIKKRVNRKISVYEQIVNSISRNVVADESVLESFTAESGKLDMDKINRKATVMYTFLEMLNSTKMVNVNEEYVKDVINSIK